MSLKVNILILALSFFVFSCRGTTTESPPIHLLQNMDDVGRLDPQSQNLASYTVDEEPYSDLDANGVWTTEPYMDYNGDGCWTEEGEEFIDLNDNKVWDPIEPYTDANNDLRYNPPEKYEDLDANGVWTTEPYEDLNGSGCWDGPYTKYINENKMSMMEPVDGTVYRREGLYSLDQSQINQIEIEETGKRNGSLIKSIPSKFIEEGFLDRGQERYNIYCSVCHGVTGEGSGMVMDKNYSWNKNVKPANLQDLQDKENSCKDGYLFDVISNGKGQMGGYPQISVSDRWAIVAYVRALSAANGVNIECCSIEDLSDIKSSLKKMASIEEKLVSDEFECLIELGKVQEVMKRDMEEIQRITKCDCAETSYGCDGVWGKATERKWREWKEGNYK